MIEVIAEHSVDTSLLSGGYAIDAGCRNFSFTKEMILRGCKVLALDVDPCDPPPGATFKRVALSNFIGEMRIRRVHDVYSTSVEVGGTGDPVSSTVLNTLLAELGGPVDVLKMDIEGSEYDVLSEPFNPIPKQISVEFHEHNAKAKHDALFSKVLANMAKHYRPVKLDRYQAHCAGYNYWDTLFIRL